ncbi:hypothetical protein B0F90DRAFT_869781 [Multifurca ochricompacta]|uniref:Uncharacterized protein n=1 Tax=Multifurca ochricompacta TaxID=376703 RepID=A0AAD4M2Y5_9AGAM|nr:hypothetical protein B0F90DRAFT_869781 [Multifurca ochricompacta]
MICQHSKIMTNCPSTFSTKQREGLEYVWGMCAILLGLSNKWRPGLLLPVPSFDLRRVYTVHLLCSSLNSTCLYWPILRDCAIGLNPLTGTCGNDLVWGRSKRCLSARAWRSDPVQIAGHRQTRQWGGGGGSTSSHRLCPSVVTDISQFLSSLQESFCLGLSTTALALAESVD